MKRIVVIGFIIWAAATIVLRLAGQYFFRVPATLLLLGSLPVMIGVAVAVLQSFRTRQDRAVAAIALAAPGMLLDTFSANWFARVFPNIPSVYAGTFGGWLLFCNVVVLLTAVLYEPRSASRV